MVVAAHSAMLLLLLVFPAALALVLRRRWGRPKGIVLAGAIAFVFAELARLIVSKGSDALFRSGALPLPSSENAALARAVVAGVLTALAIESVRALMLGRAVANHEEPNDNAPQGDGAPVVLDVRTLLLFGLGFGGAALALAGALEFLLAGAALVLEGLDFAQIAEYGLDEVSARRLGLKVYEWWARPPSEPFIFALGQLALLAVHAGLTLIAGRGLRGGRALFYGLATAIHAIMVSCAMLFPRAETYGACALVTCALGAVLWRDSSQRANSAKSAL
ncbi:MAG: YhfC family glutamic-type intramembrane protease [Myxococcota bacterium]